MKRIAIIGTDNKARFVLSKALSYLTGYDIAGKTDYSIQAVQYGLDKELTTCQWPELFVYLLASFSERIVVEQQYGRFISNGSVLLELATVKTLFKMHTARMHWPKELAVMLSGIEKVITTYARQHYDAHVLIENGIEHEDTFSGELESGIKDLIAEHGAIYRVRHEFLLAEMLENISSAFHLSPMTSTQTALQKAQSEILK